jgi:hypothetical protein
MARAPFFFVILQRLIELSRKSKATRKEPAVQTSGT